VQGKNRPRKTPGQPPISVVVAVVPGHISQVVERDGVVVLVVVENIIIVQIDIRIVVVIDLDVVVEDQIFLFRCGLFHGFLVGLVGHETATGLAGVDHDSLARVGADDRVPVHVVEPFSGCGADAFDAPFLFGHDTPLHNSAVSRDAVLCHSGG
jgi:hypothetical protein